MPTYEYRCKACGHEFERFQKISDPPVRTCPECKKRRVERLISAGGGVVFKGSGFYATDYRKPPPAESKGEGEKGEEPKKKGKAKDSAARGPGPSSSRPAGEAE